MTITWQVKGQMNEALVASGGAVASDRTHNIPVIPPAAWFAHQPEFDEAYPVRFETDGRVHGFISVWGVTHISYLNKDVYTPKSKTNYSKFRTGSVVLDDGSTIATGRLTINTVHPKKRGEAMNKVTAYYDDSGCAVADVTVFENEIGIYVAGAARPSATDEELRIARGSDWSPDWRAFKGNYEMVSLLAVNLSGFIVDGLVASGGIADGEDVTSDDIVIPGDTYCEVNADGELVCIIGDSFKPIVEDENSASAPSELEARLEALETYVRGQQLAETLARLVED